VFLFLSIPATAVVAQRGVPPTRSHHPDIPYQSPASLGAASYAKVLCSAVFVSGRDVDEVRQNSAYFLMNAPDRDKPIAVDVDRRRHACGSPSTASPGRRRSMVIRAA
jgi:hypothetical protein